MTDAGQRPLAAHELFHSRDLDEARERVAAVFCPHRLETLAEAQAFDACHHHLRGERLSLNYIEYGARTRIEPGELGHFYLVQIPLQGAAEIRNGPDHYVSTPGEAAVLNPHRATQMVWEAGTRQVLVQIARSAVEEYLARELGEVPRATLAFRGGFDLTSPGGAAFRRMVLYLIDEADLEAPAIGAGLMARQMESTLIAGLIEGHAHDLTPALARQRAAPRPRHLRLAEGYIEAHLDRPITLEEVAGAAGISARALQLAFREHRGTTPLTFWRDQRLARAHADLLAGQSGETVTDIALRWGFSHFGRFSEIYRARYGLSPRAALRAGRV